MRIIKNGKLPPKEKKMTCPECGCVFMYDRSDVNSDQRDAALHRSPSPNTLLK